MRYALVIATLVATACQVDVTTSSSSIVGGSTDAAHGSVIAIVGRRTTCEAPEKLVCSGTLVGPRAVLTAAHCLDAVQAHELEVLVTAEVRAPARALAVWAAIIHPDYDPVAPPAEANDLALLVLEADAGVAPSALAASAPATGATARYVGFGSPDPFAAPGVRLAADAVIETVDARAIWTSAGGVPCGGDSGGALFVDTAGGEVLAGVIKGSALECASPGVATRVDAAAAFVTAALASADATTEPGRPPLDASADFCAVSCASQDDCALGMLCLNERGLMRCGYRDVRTTLFGDRCVRGASCVPVGQGAARDCRMRVACDAGSDGCNAAGRPSGLALLLLVVLYALRGRAMPYASRRATSVVREMPSIRAARVWLPPH